jgi:hypothetical protein
MVPLENLGKVIGPIIAGLLLSIYSYAIAFLHICTDDCINFGSNFYNMDKREINLFKKVSPLGSIYCSNWSSVQQY